MQHNNELSDREKEVYSLLIKGYDLKEIMEKLYIEKSTAKTHLSHIFRKKNVHSHKELLIQRIKELEKWINRRYIHNR